MPAWRILRFARTSRWAIVASGTRKARAISGVVMPARVRRVSATWASKDSAGWQQVNMRRRRSSGTSSSSLTSASPGSMTATSQRLGRAQPGAPRPVDGAVAGHRREPGAGAARDAVAGPALQRGGEGILRALLGQVPVAGQADQGRDDPAPLGVERLGNGGLDVGRHISQIGLTSTDPSRAPGIRAATSMASSRSLQSTRK